MTLKQGVPYGSVLSPLLFLLYIDDLASAVGVPQVSLFAEDAAVWTLDTDLKRATSKLQKGLDAIASWSTSALYLSRQQIRYNQNPKFLGITYDPQLTYGLHASIVGSKTRQQVGAMR